MSRQVTVFYSWQSDTPPKGNRTFIEKALIEALKQLHSDATLEEALRDTKIELDKDTKGVAGSPPITETILKKIETCSVFVADLTFVGESKTGLTNSSGAPRLFANPNVLIEYGYALRCHSHSKLIGIMNTAYGEPGVETLPFDLRHLRWPITYHVRESHEERDTEFRKLAEILRRAIGLIILAEPRTEPKAFIPQQSMTDAALFFNAASALTGDRREEFSIPDGGKAFLRLYPTQGVPALASELHARQLASDGNLRPLGRVSGCCFDRNMFGALVYEAPEGGRLFHLTQLFLSREIWGIDARVLNANHILERLREWNLGVVGSTLIASGYIEEYFAKALANYFIFAQKQLKLPPPLRVQAGLVGIKGYPIAIRNNQIVGKALRDVLSWETTIESYGVSPLDVLGPFFDLIWANCGIHRTTQDQEALVRRLEDVLQS